MRTESSSVHDWIYVSVECSWNRGEIGVNCPWDAEWTKLNHKMNQNEPPSEPPEKQGLKQPETEKSEIVPMALMHPCCELLTFYLGRERRDIGICVFTGPHHPNSAWYLDQGYRKQTTLSILLPSLFRQDTRNPLRLRPFSCEFFQR